MPYLAVSITVGDAGPGPATLEYLIGDLSRICHERALEHFHQTTTECSFRAFATERDERQAFADFMAKVNTPADHVAQQLALWDQAERGVAIVHWFEKLPQGVS